MNTFHTDVSVLIGNLFKLERCGRYEEALAELRDIWEDTTTLPDVSNFVPRAAAEVILRCGALIGFLGQIKQLPNSQEKSKNLLTEARKRFLDIYDLEKAAECENYISLAYLRAGELVEAETWNEESLSHNLPNLCNATIYSYLTKSLILQTAGKYEELEGFLRPREGQFRKFGNDFLLGSFCTNLSLALKKIGNIPESLKYLESARSYHQKSDHQIYLGTVENNLSQLYKMQGRFDLAYQTIDSATNIFRKLKDRAREGFSLDTKAQIFCAEGKYQEALKTIEKSISILSRGENAAFLVETILSKAKILFYLDDFTKAFLCLSEAVEIARKKISEARAEDLAKEFETLLKEKNSPVINKTFTEKEIDQENSDEKLELVLHPSISHYQEFQGVWIKNSFLENVGLRKGSLAVVTNDTIKRGDLVAISENKTDSVLCGFYDSDFGFVCLEGIGDEPQLFNKDEIKILGKIVGVGQAKKNSDGKIIVEPLNL